MRLITVGNGNTLAEHVRGAYTFFQRLKGLMFTKSLPADCGLHIRPCSAVHTFFMRYNIDILYLDAQHKIVGTQERVKPGKFGAVYLNSVSVIELPEGTIGQKDIQIGQTVRLEKNY